MPLTSRCFRSVRSGGWIALSALAAGCVSRPLDFAACGDGILEPGEVCFVWTSEKLEPALDLHATRVADFDGDGHADVLALGLNEAASVTAVLAPGDGDGHLGPATPTSLYACSAHPIVGDVDGDGATDVLMDNCGPSVFVFHGGAGDFSGPLTVDVAAATETAGLHDVDGDGDIDVTVWGYDEAMVPRLTVALADGVGGFAPPIVSLPGEPAPGFDAGGILVGDLDEDGIADGLLVDPVGGFAFMAGLGGGQFASATGLVPNLPAGAAEMYDVDDDGHLDLVIRTSNPAKLVFAAGDGTGAFAVTTETPLASDEPVSTSGRADFDGDGAADLVFARPAQAIVEIWLGDATGGFSGPEIRDVADVPDQLGVADLNEDGAPDLVISSVVDDRIRVVLADP